MSAAVALAGTTIGPPPPWYRPMQCALQDTPLEQLSAQPQYTGTPLYGAIHLGDGEDDTYSIVVDLAPDWAAFGEAYKAAQGKVEMSSVPARIYIDANNDEDLMNDGEGLLDRCNASPQQPGSFTISRGAKCQVAYADGVTIEYPMDCYMFPQRPPVKLPDGSDRQYSRTLFYHRNACFETKLPVGDATLGIRFYDENSDGLIVTEDKDRLGLDLNQDGTFDPNSRGPEIYDLNAPFSFGGESYVLRTFGPRGGDPTAVVSEQKVAAPVYILAGKPAPDFAMPTLDGGTFTLSAQKGKIVILDFWATWCGPCRDELPNVVKMWDELKDKGLVLVGISLDFDDKDAKATDKVAKFAPENGMTWTHIVEGKYWDSEIGRLYQVSGIPQTVLVDREGKISALGLRGEKLHEAAKKALGEG
jgi:thiol-disulfide isomerase/thioredoxin